MFAPAVQRAEVVNSGHAQRLRKEVGTFQGEVRGVIGAHTGASREDVCWPGTVIEDPRHDLIDDPRLIRTVSASTFLQRYVLVGPGFGVVAIYAVELDPAAVDEIGHNVDHAAGFEVSCVPHLVRKDKDRTTPMPVCNN